MLSDVFSKVSRSSSRTNAMTRLICRIPVLACALIMRAEAQSDLRPETGPLPRAGGTLDPNASPQVSSPAAAMAPRASGAFAPAAGGRRETVIYAVWVAPGANQQLEGGFSPVIVRVEPNNTGEPAVGATEGTLGGLGPQWKSATWLAAFNASRVSDHMLADYEFTVKVGSGRIDGPSASMLTSVAMLALINGDELLQGTTMSGTINPDGTCGPVGGLAQKMQGLKERESTSRSPDGKPLTFLRFGYPVGCRMSINNNAQEQVDLHEWGRGLGFAEVREIADIYDAYEFLTGKSLPRTRPLAESDMELPLPVRQRLRAKVEAVSARIQQELPTLKERAKKQKRDSSDDLATLDYFWNRATDFRKSGYEEAAYSELVGLYSLVHQFSYQLEMEDYLADHDWPATRAHLTKLASVNPWLESLMLESRSLASDESLASRMTAITGLGFYSQSVALKRQAEDWLAQLDDGSKRSLAAKPGTPAQDQTNWHGALAYYAITHAYIMQASDWFSIGQDDSRKTSTQEEKVSTYAKSLTATATALGSYFETVVTGRQAANSGSSAEDARKLFCEQNQPFVIAKSAVQSAEAAAVPDPVFQNRTVERNNYQIGHASQAFLMAASLINQHYCLGEQTGAKGEIILSNRKILSTQLDLARDHAREAAARCKKELGFVPWSVLMNYQIGKASRDGTGNEDKLMALVQFWSAALSAETALRLVDR